MEPGLNGSETGDSRDQQQVLLPFSSELVNMTTCHCRFKGFFRERGAIHFNNLIAYWMAGGYLGPVESVEEAYRLGYCLLHDLIYEKGVLKFSDGRDKNTIEFVVESEPNSCQHPPGSSSISWENVWSYIFKNFKEIDNIMLTDGVLKKRQVAVNLDCQPSSGEEGHSKYIAHFNPTLDSLKPLLEDITELSVLVLRGCESVMLPLEILTSLTALEISGSSYLTTIPQNTISQLIHLEYLNLSDLLIESLPNDCFSEFRGLCCLVMRRCSKLRSLPPIDLTKLKILDLSHCTVFEELAALPGSKYVRLRLVDFSYTALTELPRLYFDNVTHLILRGSKLGALTRKDAKHMHSLEILDLSDSEHFHELHDDFKYIQLLELNLSGCISLRILREDIFSSRSGLWKLNLSRTKLKRLPSLANLTRLSELSLRDLELDSLESLKSLSALVKLDLKGLKLTSSQEQLHLDDDFFESLEKLQVLNLSQTTVAKLPNMSKLANLRELILADCQRLNIVPDLRTLPNLEVLDLSLADGSAVNCQQVAIDFGACFSSLSTSLRKLVLTNRSGVQKLFPLTSVGNLEFLDLRGTDVTSIPPQYVDQIKCIHLPSSVIDLSEAQSSGVGNLQRENNLDCNNIQGEDHPGRRRASKPAEIHIVSSFEMKSSSHSSNKASSSNLPSGFERFKKDFKVLEALISEIQENFKSSAAKDSNQIFKLQSLHSDLEHIQKNIDSLKSSRSCKMSEELLQELMGAATHLSAADFLKDSTNFTQLLRIVIKLKLLIPRTEAETPEASEITKKKKKPWFEKSKKKENGAEISKELSRSEYQDLLSSYEALTAIEKNCLLCFSVFPYNEDNDDNNNTAAGPGSLAIKKRMLLYWWVGEGFIGPNANACPNTAISRSIETGANEPKTIEEVGECIFKVLTNKGFIEPVMEKGRETTSCRMHPSVHAFLTAKAKEAGFFDFNQENGKLTSHFTRSLRACLLKSQDNFTSSSCKLWEETYAHSPQSLESFTNVRTLFNVNDSMVDIKPEWFSKMKHLSVLHLGSWRSDNLEPIEVKNQMFFEGLKKMKQLRLLSMQGMSTIMKLPDSVCKLTELIILDLRECTYLEELPTDIGSLKNLTHLDMTNCSLLTMLPKGIRLLSKLEVLKGFAITNLGSGGNTCIFTDLLNLMKLRKLSIIVNVNTFPNDKELQVLKEMCNLRKLKISWENDYNVKDRKLCQSAAQEDSRISKLKKLKWWEHKHDKETSRSKHLDNIEKLELWCYPNKTAPHWLDPTELKKLKKLYIVGGSLTNLHGGTNQNKWNVTALRLKYLPKLESIRWRDLRTMFPNLTYLEKHQCPTLPIYPCDDKGIWKLELP